MQIFGATDIGTARSSNQDSFVNTVLSSNVVLSVVCDGMGGANAGNVASGIASSVITDYVKRSFVPDMKPSTIKNMLKSAIDTANEEVFEAAERDETLKGMGTTVVVALVVGDTAHIAHVGDSRAYFVGESAVQLTRDHSMIQSLLESGHLTAEEALNHPKRNVITRAVGILQAVESDYTVATITNGTLILCTDGVSNAFLLSDLESIVKSTQIVDLPNTLIKIANDSDSGDNVTVTAVALN